MKSALHMTEAEAGEALVKLLSVLGFKLAQFSVAAGLVKVLMKQMGCLEDKLKSSSSARRTKLLYEHTHESKLDC